MRNRGRPGNEYAVAEHKRIARLEPEEPKKGWPELRVVRPVDLTSADVPEWGDFLNHLGSENPEVGIAYALGSARISYVPASEMTTMLRDKYPKCRSPQQTVVLQRKVSEGLLHYMRGATMDAYDGTTAKMEQAYVGLGGISCVNVSNELEDPGQVGGIVDYDPLPSAVATYDFQDEVLPLADEQLPFLNGTFSVKGIALFGRGYALDLSANPQLHEERDSVLGYLRREEKLDTSRLHHDGWEPHATVFKPHEHLRAASTAITYAMEVPPTIDFIAPKAEVSKDF